MLMGPQGPPRAAFWRAGAAQYGPPAQKNAPRSTNKNFYFECRWGPKDPPEQPFGAPGMPNTGPRLQKWTPDPPIILAKGPTTMLFFSEKMSRFILCLANPQSARPSLEYIYLPTWFDRQALKRGKYGEPKVRYCSRIQALE